MFCLLFFKEPRRVEVRSRDLAPRAAFEGAPSGRLPEMEVLKIELFDAIYYIIKFNLWSKSPASTHNDNSISFSHAHRTHWLYASSSNDNLPNLSSLTQQHPRPPCKTVPPRHGHLIYTRPGFFHVSIHNVDHEHRDRRAWGVGPLSEVSRVWSSIITVLWRGVEIFMDQ